MQYRSRYRDRAFFSFTAMISASGAAPENSSLWPPAATEARKVPWPVEYIIRKARELDRPVAICIGLGTNAGSHDGYSVFEE